MADKRNSDALVKKICNKKNDPYGSGKEAVKAGSFPVIFFKKISVV